MRMTMQMSFEASKTVTLWLKQWHTNSWSSYLLSCFALVGLCLLHEVLNAYRTSFHQQYVSSPAAEYDRLQAPGEAGNGTGIKRYKAAQPCLPYCAALRSQNALHLLSDDQCIHHVCHQACIFQVLLASVFKFMPVYVCRPMSITAARATHSLLYAVNLSFSYLLMLAVMTYNVGFFFVIVLGLALGNFLFGGSSKTSDVCHTSS